MKTVWFPVKSRGVYEPVEYLGDEYLSPKKYVKKSEDDCIELCNKLNNEIQKELFKATKIINKIKNKYHIESRFLLPMIDSQLYNMESHD